jgi:hypothetical protein
MLALEVYYLQKLNLDGIAHGESESLEQIMNIVAW